MGKKQFCFFQTAETGNRGYLDPALSLTVSCAQKWHKASCIDSAFILNETIWTEKIQAQNGRQKWYGMADIVKLPNHPSVVHVL